MLPRTFVLDVQMITLHQAYSKSFLCPKLPNKLLLMLEDFVLPLRHCLDLQNTQMTPKPTLAHVFLCFCLFFCLTHVVRARLPLPGLTLPEDSASVRKLL